MTDTYLINKLPSIEAQIDAAEEALSEVNASGGRVSYEYDSGQSRQEVKNVGVSELNATITRLYERRRILRVRLGLERGVVYSGSAV